MRAIDFWVGIPLTFLLTVVYPVSSACVGLAASPAGPPRNILFIQLAEMGTMVVAYPSLRKARELFPDATLHFLCFTQIRSSVEMLGIVAPENIITIDAQFGHVARCATRLLFPSRARRRRIDTVINMEAFVRYSSIAELSVGRPPTRWLPPVQSGGAVRGRPAHAQSALQRAYPCGAYVPRSGPRARSAARPGAARQTAASDGLASTFRRSRPTRNAAAGYLAKARATIAAEHRTAIASWWFSIPTRAIRFPMRRLPAGIVR